MDEEEDAVASVDAFRRRVSAGKYKFGVPFALHVAIASWLVYSLLDTGAFGTSELERLFDFRLTSILCWLGILTLTITSVLGMRITRERSVERWRWPVLLPTLTLVVLQMFVFSTGTKLAHKAGDLVPDFGASVFALSALAIGGAAEIARVGYGFAACALSLAGWCLALSAQRETAGSAVRFQSVPAVLALAFTAACALFAPLGDFSLVLILGALGAVALFLGRSGGTSPSALRDLAGAALLLGGACVLAGLHHYNQALSGARPGDTDVAAAAVGLAQSIERAQRALNVSWIAAFGFFWGAAVSALVRMSELGSALKRSVPLLIGGLLCFVAPWAGARVQLGKAIGNLESASRAMVPAKVKLPDVAVGSKAEGWFGEPWVMTPTGTALSPKAAARPAQLSEADCEAFAKALVASKPFGKPVGAIDRDVPYARAYCVLSPLAALGRSRVGGEYGVNVMGRLAPKQPMPRTFRAVEAPPGSLRLYPDARGWDPKDVIYVHVGVGAKYTIDVAPTPVDAPEAVRRVRQHNLDGVHVVAVSAAPKAKWGDVFRLATHLPLQMVVLGAPETQGTRWSVAPSKSDAEVDAGRGADDDLGM